MNSSFFCLAAFTPAGPNALPDVPPQKMSRYSGLSNPSFSSHTGWFSPPLAASADTCPITRSLVSSSGATIASSSTSTDRMVLPRKQMKTVPRQPTIPMILQFELCPAFPHSLYNFRRFVRVESYSLQIQSTCSFSRTDLPPQDRSPFCSGHDLCTHRCVRCLSCGLLVGSRRTPGILVCIRTFPEFFVMWTRRPASS